MTTTNRQNATKSDNPKIEKALLLFANGSTITQASEEAGISRQTLSKAINHDTGTQTKLREYMAEIVEGETNKARRVFNKALDAIEDFLDDDLLNTPAERAKIAVAFIGKLTPIIERQAEQAQERRRNIAEYEEFM